MRFGRREFRKWTGCGIAPVSFGLGSLVRGFFTHLTQARADSNRVFELRVYYAVPGKLPALESRFRETASKLLARHHLNAVGYWVPEDAPASESRFIYILAHSSREEAKKNWDAMFADPAFQEMVKSEQAEKLVGKVESTYMRPTDFSPMK